ncbi:MAG: phenylalanine--tRNA ligase subunit beta [Gallionellales bacterium 35-53-114]|jgi:phenylalanyl-tRNA synthetase beta chain|nr:MAG: phenylalanine--tRNA ligase subunit beta [Gallionellales bacterium 35-53-114]OYZ63106.1 MAG: phenylalanine--tRNA ligase subunit beta [Gallionellales bacterium 24-53-125]OZB08914.1 MAG: phenylalanine--tRNA ligase subunit beta [Gallionellales bacterium 39-52-133]HQS59415.1 phenylalanine--tRNA ligase subunit beta [Gallionellaceae bacterium]HQS76328.1 phenylalanine--tRNA ligase subunit beta [Gallionellaceae bacterium]
MQFSESWLRSLVNPSLTSEELAHLLTMAGLEVEESRPVAAVFDHVVVAQVLSKGKHPDADRLNILTVNTGQGEPLTIVCGAQNVSVGMKAPCALVGAKLPGIEIKQAKVRGVASFGMMCSAKELGLADESSGLLELAEDASVGQSIREHLELDDHLLTLKLTPNRSDCLSLYGIAREVSALTDTSLSPLPKTSFVQTSAKKIAVKVAVPEACPRYVTRVIAGVNARASTPLWMTRRLERCGLRSISAIVDVTNYVLLEMGQPLHAFDLSKLNGDIEVRFAKPGEQLQVLNQQNVELQPDMLVIADARGAVALAGVMGGAATAVDDATTEILLESAFFSPSVIVGKSRRLGFGSDSSYRFERGVDFSMTQAALDRATQLIIDVCGGQAGQITEVLGQLPDRKSVTLRVARVQRVLGMPLESKEISQILSRLGMEVKQNGEVFSVTPPSYRFDIAIEEDLIEELARVHGYENIPPLPPQATMSILPQVEAQRPLPKLRQALVMRDYQEAINYAFVDAAWERDLCANNAPIALKNPIASQMSVMRSSLLGGLLASLRTNLGRKQTRVRLFELGACFMPVNGSYAQSERVAGLVYGAALSEQWGTEARNVDFYDVKGDVEALFAPRKLVFEAAHHPASHPGRSACILLDGQVVGWLGELHPQWQQQYDLPLSAVWFEIEQLPLLQAGMPKITEVSRFPMVRRDIAVLVDEAITAQSLIQAMQAENAPNVVELALFDLYRGKGVTEGKKSLAFRVLLQDTQKTLTDIEIEQSLSQLVIVLQRNGAQLRE